MRLVFKITLPAVSVGALSNTHETFTAINDAIGKNDLARISAENDIGGHASRLAMWVLNCLERILHEFGSLKTRIGHVE